MVAAGWVAGQAGRGAMGWTAVTAADKATAMEKATAPATATAVKATYDDNHMRDFIDVYLREIKDGGDPGFNGEYFNIQNIIKMFFKIFLKLI